MKLKFKADSKDLKYFLIFALFLVYPAALIVANLYSIADDGKFSGLNPLPAFSRAQLFPTITVYLLMLVGVFVTVSSYFFEREKGIGLGVGKSEKNGDSRWAKEDEIKKVQGVKLIDPSQKSIPYAGMPLLVKPGKAWVDDGESHSLIMGSTGSGKTSRLIDPLIAILAKKGESMILTDPKGELYQHNTPMLIEKGYNIIVINLRNPQNGNAWNPLSLPYELYKKGSDKANELLADLAKNLVHDEGSKADPFWQDTAGDFFVALALGLFEDGKQEEINLNSISYMDTVGDQKYGNSTYIKEYFASKNPAKPVYIKAAGTINAPNETRNSILSTFRQKINIFALTEQLSEMLSHSDFDMRSIGEKKTAVFIIIQDEKKTYHSLATIFVKQCYETLIDVALGNNGKLPIRTNFILDEFANMPALKDVTTMITAARSRQIRFNMVIQNFAQLNQVYGEHDAETIKGNCGNVIYLMSKELKALEEISRLCGEKKIKGKEGKEEKVPLINISELQRLKMGDAIILKDRSFPLKVKLLGTWEIGINELPSAKDVTIAERARREIKIFEIRDKVKELKGGDQNNLFAGMNQRNGMPPMFGGPMMGGLPSAPGMPNMGGVPGMGTTPESLDINDFIKQIDAKIAALEAEEAAEAAKSNPVSASVAPKIEPLQKDTFIEPVKVEEKPIVITPVSTPELVINEEEKPSSPPESSVSIYEEVPDELAVKINPNIDKIINDAIPEENTDDQFFDDFFGEDEE